MCQCNAMQYDATICTIMQAVITLYETIQNNDVEYNTRRLCTQYNTTTLNTIQRNVEQIVGKTYLITVNQIKTKKYCAIKCKI